MMDLGNLEECYEKFLTTRVEDHFLVFFQSVRAFIAGLAAFKIYRDTVNDALWKSFGEKRVQEFKLWAEQGSAWNFEHKLQLMEAEHSYCCGHFDRAAELYKKAIASARAHKYINDEALACELAGKFFLDRDNVSLSLEYLTLAHEKYSEWKAEGKANHLFEFINGKFVDRCILHSVRMVAEPS